MLISKEYKDKNYSKVWSYLNTLSPKEITSNQKETEEVLERAMEILGGNLEKIFFALKKYGFIFLDDSEHGLVERNLETNPPYLIKDDNSNILSLLDSIELYGKLPLLFSMLYSKIEYISFEGYFPEHSDIVLDPLVLLPLNHIEIVWEMNLNSYNEELKYPISFSPEELAKNNISGNGLYYSILLSKNISINATVQNYEHDDISFLDYLRNGITYGGLFTSKAKYQARKNNFIESFCKSLENNVQLF